MDGMYYSCKALSSTPSIGSGVGTMDYVFVDCPNLKQAPRVPKGAISARDVTACCPGIDATKDKERAGRAQSERDRYERSLDRKGLFGKIGSAFAACLQCHALRKQGYGLLYAPMLVHKRRQQGRMGTTLASGIADVLQAGETQKGLEIADDIRKRERGKEAARADWKKQKLAEWDELYGDGTKPSRAVRAMAADGAKDRDDGLFMHMSHEPPEETWAARALRSRRQGTYEGMEAAVAAHWEEGELDEAARAKVADWYRERLDETLAYYRSAKDAIGNGSTDRFRDDELRGLQAVMQLSGGPLVESVGRMQEQYHVLDEGDLRRFDSALKEMGLGSLASSKADVSKDAAASYTSALAGRRGADAPVQDAEEDAEPVDPFRGSRSGPRNEGKLAALQDIARRSAKAAAAGFEAFVNYGKTDEPSSGKAAPDGQRPLPDISGVKNGPGGPGGPTL
jgi:hypothetical protein